MANPFVLHGPRMWRAEQRARALPVRRAGGRRRSGLRRGGASLAIVGILTISVAVSRVNRPEPAQPSAGALLSSVGATESLARIHFIDLRTGIAIALPRSVRAIDGVEHLQAGPRGKRLAFDDGSRIYVAKLDGTHLRALTPRLEVAFGPSWSPDGRRIVFSTGSGAAVVNISTRSVERVVGGPGQLFRIGFGPDGRSFLYTRARHSLGVFGRTSQGRIIRLPLRRAGFASISPDGTRIAFRRTDFDGHDVTEMTSDDVWIARSHGRPRSLGGHWSWMSQVDPERLWPSWSPSGRRIAFERLYGRALTVMDVATGRGTRLGRGQDPTWVDDHTLIVQNFEPSLRARSGRRSWA